MPDKYSAVWVSHSSISDFMQCPRAYYLHNVYKDPKSGHKISIISPPLALGKVVHNVLESLSTLKTDERFREPLMKKYDAGWEKVTGEKGGFASPEQEAKYKRRGEDMIRRVQNNPGPLEKLAVKINQDLPHFWLSEEDGIILCGKVDWLEYLPDNDSVHIVDFKTSKSNKENPDSLQLPIYHLLAHNCQKFKVEKVSYWYLEQSDRPTSVKLPTLENSEEKVLAIAKKIKLARQLEKFDCPKGEDGCWGCQPYEAILRGEAKFVENGEYGDDVYVVERDEETMDTEGVVL